jgi:hypothetical protein
MHVCMYVCMYIRMYVCVYIHARIHTNTHIPAMARRDSVKESSRTGVFLVSVCECVARWVRGGLWCVCARAELISVCVCVCV